MVHNYASVSVIVVLLLVDGITQLHEYARMILNIFNGIRERKNIQ